MSANTGADDLGRMERVRDNLATEITAIKTQRARLLRVPRDERSVEAQSEIERLTGDMDSQIASRQGLDRQIISRTAARVTHERANEPVSVLGRPAFGEFLAQTFWSFDALISLLLSAVFPIAALAFGYISACAAPNMMPPVAFNIRRELEIGADRPEAGHPAYAEMLKSALGAYVLALRTGGDLAKEAAILRLRDDRSLDMLRAFGTLKNQISSSRLSDEAKEDLNTHIDRLETEQFHRPTGRA